MVKRLQIKNLEFKFQLENILFRHCRFEDIAQVMHVNRVTLPENYSRYTFLSLLRTYPDLFIVAVDENKDQIVGYIMNKIDTGYSFFDKSSAIIKKGHVFSIGVLPGYRKRGIATGLLGLAFNYMFKRSVSEIFLEVRVSNIPAIKLYEKFGMKKVDTIPYYYADGETAYVMAVKTTDVYDIAKKIATYLIKTDKFNESIEEIK